MSRVDVTAGGYQQVLVAKGGCAMDEVRPQLDALAAQVAQGNLGAAEDWGGADVVITATSPPDGPESSFYPHPRFVVTEFAPQLSWLFIQLRDVFAPWLDAQNKYVFHGRLADAASGHLTDNPGSATPQTLCAAVVNEAAAMARTGSMQPSRETKP